MAGCTCENWSLQDLSSALQDMHKDNKRIVVPMFQRGKRWKKAQEQKFIDSLIKGYPVGTMLFYETYEDNKRTYILVDGLQRGNSIKKYMTNPTEFFYDDSISDEFCCSVLKLVHQSDEKELYTKIRGILTAFIKEQKTFKNLQYFSVAKQIADEFSAGFEPIEQLIEVIKIFFEERQDLYDRIASTIIPVIVYTGDENNLPEIFDRINSQGTPLDQYEVYAAAWPVKQKFAIKNADIVEHVVRKYDTFEEDDFKIHGYNREEMRTQKTVNAFETALYKSIEFVRDSILVITKFKGNSRNANKIFHSKYQILSMISTTFKEMYAGVDFTQFSDTWQERRQKIARNLVQYYVYDIITNYWSEGGTGKIHSAAKPNRYMIEIPSRAWMVALDGFFERSMLRAEKKNIANPRSEEYVILNCIYLKTFTAMDQLSIDRFDVEHIAPKEQMRKLIEACDGDGLPISCIANLCYLPEYVNRSKGAKNFYQDKKYLQHIDLSEVESKYSFTESDDLEWMDMPYEKPEDFAVLREYYTDYCAKRFDKLKHLLCDSLEIKYEEIEPQETEVVQKVVVAKKSDDKPSKQVRFADKCIVRLAKVLNTDLVKVGRSSYRSTDGKRGYVITTSKMYTQGKREKYWFAYRTSPFDELSDCEEKYVVYGCKDENTLVVLPVPVIEEQLDRVNVSYDEDENISHWHMVFFRDTAGKMTWMLSRPNIEEIEINSFLV